jgi:hypothetical protein
VLVARDVVVAELDARDLEARNARVARGIGIAGVL